MRKVRGPILDKLYTRLKRCGDLSCTGKPFTEHRNVPALTINRDDSRPIWRQVSEALAQAIQSGDLAPGDELPSITELSALQSIGTGVIRHAMPGLSADLSGIRQPLGVGQRDGLDSVGRDNPPPGHGGSGGDDQDDAAPDRGMRPGTAQMNRRMLRTPKARQ